MLRLENAWTWDSWIADDGEFYHLFYLQAPRELLDPGRRHLKATIGHARTRDLVSWEVLPDALVPDPDGWDSVALWTGSVARGDDGVWRMYYTGISERGYGVRDQRVGIAESDDLITWRRVPGGPAVEADPRWYKTLPEDVGASETWRDPMVFRDPGGDGWHMFVTARGLDAGQNDDGVIAHARSHDMLTWEVGPPLTPGGTGFGQLEVLQVCEIDGQHMLVFTCHPQEMTPERIERTGFYCTWVVPGDGPLGPWDIDAALPFDAEPMLFAAPLVQQRDGTWAFVGFRNFEHHGVEGYGFEIFDPLPVRRDGNRLVPADQ